MSRSIPIQPGTASVRTVQTKSQRRRLVEVTGFVAVWAVLGHVLRADSETYLLMGVPLTVAFQLLIRRRPLREFWVRDAPAFTLDRRGVALAGALMVTPLHFGLQAVLQGARWALVCWWLVAAAGAVFAAFAVRSIQFKVMLHSAVAPSVVGTGALILGLGGFHIITGSPVDGLAAAGTVLKYLAIYLPVTFVLEEVTFRGVLDAHVHEPGEQRGRQSALFISALWGLWHLPVSPSGFPIPLLILFVIVWHSLIGFFLSMAWRRTGNLAGAGLAHAAIDAVRNALMPGL